jgi:hypothetical protein
MDLAESRSFVLTQKDHVAGLLNAIEEVLDAKRRVQAEGQTEAGEYLALQALTAAEEQLQALVLDPWLRGFLGNALQAYSQMAGEAA